MMPGEQTGCGSELGSEAILLSLIRASCVWCAIQAEPGEANRGSQPVTVAALIIIPSQTGRGGRLCPSP